MKIIQFNRHLYPLKAIKLSIKDYNHLAKFKIDKKKDYLIVTLDKIDSEVKNIIQEEFCNYVLANIRNY